MYPSKRNTLFKEYIMAIVIRSISGLKFALTGERQGYAHSKGLGFFDTESNEWISGNNVDGSSTEFPYIPAGGRAACKQILDNPGEFFNLQPRVKSL
jgi:hypothetical protein